MLVDRYCRPEMRDLWSKETKYKTWFEVEANICEAFAIQGMIPESSAQVIWEKGQAAIEQLDIPAIDDIEAEVKHDVIAFLTWMERQIGEEAKYMHYGMTSSDLLDTSFALLLKQSAELIESKLVTFMDVLKKRAEETKYLVTIGRSHGVHAEPTSFGLKFASFYAEMKRNLERLRTAKKEISVAAISGAVGNYSSIDPAVEKHMADKLGLSVDPISTQVIARDRHAAFFSALAILASSIERIVVEVRHLQRTELREAEEFFSKGQKGSSAMPHKRNPVLSENLTGIARLIRSSLTPALEDVVLWHERDISHSSVERVIAPQATSLTDFALHRLTGLIDNLVIFEERVSENLNLTKGLVYSQQVLLALIEKGFAREEAYKIVQRNAMMCWETGQPFKEILQNDDEVMQRIPQSHLDLIFENKKALAHIDLIFDRVFSS